MSLQRFSKLKLFTYRILRIPSVFSNAFLSTTNYQQTVEQGESNDHNKPVKYINSPAHKWKAEHSRRGTNSEPRLWYEPYVVSLSLAVFLGYFCVLREESDIDQELGRSLYSRVDGMEEVQLRISYKHNKENGIDVADLEKRMKELGMKLEQNA